MSKDSFNLMSQAWLPVTMLADGSHQELSMREVLLRAHEIQSIDGDIPVQRFSLTRMLIAALYGIFAKDAPISESLWRELLKAGSQDKRIAALINDYCDLYASRFDLFDEKQPFYQVADLHTAKNEVFGLERLILDVPSGEPFFTTRSGSGLESISAAEAARWLVTLQAFDTSGIKSGAVGDERVKGGKGYPIGAAWGGTIGGFLVEGPNLWETLVLNLVGEEFLRMSEPGVSWSSDKPIWERAQLTEEAAEGFNQEQENVGNPIYFHGPATLMTWQSRRIRLFHEEGRVNGILVCNGDRLKPQNAQGYEMMSGWRRSAPQEKALKKPLVYMPRRHDPSRALWRGLPSLTTANKSSVENGVKSYLRPYLFDWLAQVNSDDSHSGLGKMPVRLHAFGIEYGNKEAVVDSAVDDALDFDLTILTSTNPSLASTLERAVNVADQGIFALRNLASDIATAAGLPTDPPREKIAGVAYAAFDRKFRQWVRTIHVDSDLTTILEDWEALAKQQLIQLEIEYLDLAPIRAILGREISTTDSAGKVRSRFISSASAEKRFRGKLKEIFVFNKEGDHSGTEQ